MATNKVWSVYIVDDVNGSRALAAEVRGTTLARAIDSYERDNRIECSLLFSGALALAYELKTFRVSCPRCSGTGFLTRYSHVYNGVCFRCNGRKTIEVAQKGNKHNCTMY